jgi:lysozyme
MNASAKAVEMIKHHEGVRFKPYRCPARLWTVGVGHVLYPAQAKLPMDQREGFALRPEDNRTFSKDEVDGILRSDLQRFERGVVQLIPVALTQGQFDACVSFAFNVGLGTLQRSTFRQKVIRGEKEAAVASLLQYCKAGGKVLRGLENRRKDEAALFLGPQ